MKIIFIFLLKELFFVCCENAFNYEIGARIHDKISDYLIMISSAGSLPMAIINQGSVNITNGIEAAPKLFYSSMVHYDGKITNFYMGLETGYFYLYGHQLSEGLHIYFDQTILIDKVWHGIRYYVDPKTGNPTTKTGYNDTYDCRVRPWYKSVKAARTPIWSEPYLDLFTRSPLLTYMSPILNQTLNNVYYSFAGTIAADIYLTDISNFLVQAYGNTDRKVFIIDKLTGNLIGNSWGAPTSVVTSSGPVSLQFSYHIN